MAELPIEEYFGFHDIPRTAVVVYRDDTYLLDCSFDDDRDDYDDHFQVWRLDRETYGRFARGEVDIDGLVTAAVDVGRVPVDAVRFDETRRRTVDDALFAGLDLAADDR